MWARTLLPELFLSMAWVGVMNAGVDKVHLAVNEGRRKEEQLPVFSSSLSGSFLPLWGALLIPSKQCSAGTSCSPKAITAFPC